MPSNFSHARELLEQAWLQLSGDDEPEVAGGHRYPDRGGRCGGAFEAAKAGGSFAVPEGGAIRTVVTCSSEVGR